MTVGAFVLLTFGALSRMPVANAAYRTAAAAKTAARVASFDTEVGDPILLSADEVLDCNDAEDRVVYRIPVINRSEVPVRIRLEVSGYGDNVDCRVAYEGEVLPALGGIGAAEITFTVKDRTRKDQQTALPEVKVRALTEQAEGGEGA